MKWTRDPNPWKRRFALLPISLRNEVIWLEWVWVRHCGYFNEVSTAKERPEWPPEDPDKPDFAVMAALHAGA